MQIQRVYSANVTYDAAVLQRAQSVATSAIRDLLSSPQSSKRGVVVSAPAGAGKSALIVEAVGACRRAKLRIAVDYSTNDQAFSLVRRIAMTYPDVPVTFVPASKVSLPLSISRLVNVRQVLARDGNSAAVIVGTLNKLGDAFARGDLNPVDALLIDESYQADSSRCHYGVGALADLHLLVGDCGQLNPFSTIDDPYVWRGLPEDRYKRPSASYYVTTRARRYTNCR